MLYCLSLLFYFFEKKKKERTVSVISVFILKKGEKETGAGRGDMA